MVDTAHGAPLEPSPSFDGPVTAVGITPDGSRLLAGGAFAHVGAVAQRFTALLDGNGALSRTQLSDVAGPASVFRPAADGLSVAMSQIGRGNSGGRWSLLDGRQLWSQRCDGDGQAVDELDGVVYSGFHEGCEGDLNIRLVASDATTSARDRSFLPSFDRFWGVFAIDAAPTALAIAGDFTSVAGVAAQGFALFPTTAAPPPPTTTTAAPTTTLAPTTTTTPVGTSFPLALGSVWRYHDGADPVPAEWAQTAFVDAAWAQGPGQLGYGDGDETTVLAYGPDARNKTRTAYFRRTVTVGSVPVSLHLSLVADDGAAVYVNGVEVVRDNLPAGPLAAATLAATNRSGPNESTPRTFTVPGSALVVGQNVVAVEVHQDAPNSSDLSFDLGLAAG